MYGRKRRISFAISVVVGIVCIITGYLVISKILEKTVFVEVNQNYEFLKYHFKSKGFTCEIIEKSGGRCYLETETRYMGFSRYEDGFLYVVRSPGYVLDIRHQESMKSGITFRTTDEALQGYKNMNYTCITKGTIVDELVECKTDKGVLLDLNSYIGVIETAIADTKAAIDASGYKVDVLLNEYMWEKK